MKVLIADDHDLVRETLAAYLLAEGLGTVSTAGTLHGTLKLVASNGPFDVILLDYNMPGMDGLAGLRQVIASAPNGAVALISGHATPALAEAALAEGARGVLPKTLGAQAMIAAVRTMHAGQVFLPLELMRHDAVPHDSFGLTSRERDVLRGICAGKSNKEIALDLDLQEVTVKLHVKTLCRKLNARNRTHAAMIARDNVIT